MTTLDPLYREDADGNDDLSDDEMDDEVETVFHDEVRARASADRRRLDLEDRRQT
ncbi:hypothetical protein Pa4123_41410 [Phytohabitans aurantiacus]|uniref:Uncharacterized protein n=1 Tax=Phytohabitans aurantiacus TaxID=3016789 RepID=A0ABQ5QY61_9ACTN|nr:hypothetical protein Pa4123_41410 [Phytohabitans aurantiacus]